MRNSVKNIFSLLPTPSMWHDGCRSSFIISLRYKQWKDKITRRWFVPSGILEISAPACLLMPVVCRWNISSPPPMPMMWCRCFEKRSLPAEESRGHHQQCHGCGDPSNFVRIMQLFQQQVTALKHKVSSVSVYWRNNPSNIAGST